MSKATIPLLRWKLHKSGITRKEFLFLLWLYSRVFEPEHISKFGNIFEKTYFYIIIFSSRWWYKGMTNDFVNVGHRIQTFSMFKTSCLDPVTTGTLQLNKRDLKNLVSECLQIIIFWHHLNLAGMENSTAGSTHYPMPQ